LLRPVLFLSGLAALGLTGFGLWKLLTRFGTGACVSILLGSVAYYWQLGYIRRMLCFRFVSRTSFDGRKSSSDSESSR
jgi:hypothetical protein